MQNFTKKASPSTLNRVIDLIKADFDKLMKDSYANYFCTKMFHTLTTDQRFTILEALAPEFVNVSCDEVGTHPM